jgi:hypothetical protein
MGFPCSQTTNTRQKEKCSVGTKQQGQRDLRPKKKIRRFSNRSNGIASERGTKQIFPPKLPLPSEVHGHSITKWIEISSSNEGI